MKGKAYIHGDTIEAKLRDLATRRGWEVHRSGWPDFLLARGQERQFIEAKSLTDMLRPEQRRMFAALEVLGIHVKIWWEQEPQTLIPWREFTARQRTYRAQMRRALKATRGL
jgi:VRR-NUC domain-containing protein